MKKSKSKKLPLCFVCLHKPPHGKCLICGYSVALKNIDPSWKARHEWLKSLYLAMKKHNQVSTDSPKIDLEIIQKFGTWSAELKVVRDVNYKIVEIIYPQSYLEQRAKANEAMPSRPR